ncbi:MAG: HDIG domain-containing protein [Deltaproteobacteria bacterium]|nr:HDIG domain-containing protein [Deltaproteobacteria bacterium]
MASNPSPNKPCPEGTPAANAPPPPQGMLGVTADFILRAKLRLFLIIFVTAVAIALLVSRTTVKGITVLPEGTYAQRSIRAPYDFEIVDDVATIKKQDDAKYSVPPILGYDPEVLDRAKFRVLSAFATAQASLRRRDAAELPTEGGTEEVINARFAEDLPEEFTPEELGVLYDADYNQAIGDIAVALLDTQSEAYVTDELPLIDKLQADEEGRVRTDKVLIRDLTAEAKPTPMDETKVITLEQARQIIEQAGEKIAGDIPPAAVPVVVKIAKSLVTPNVRVMADETQERRAAAVREVIPVRIVYKKNQLIVGEGHHVTTEQAMVLRWLSEHESGVATIPRVLGLAILLSILVYFAFYVSDVNIPAFNISERDFTFLGINLVLTLVFFRLFMFLGDILALQSPLFSPTAMLFLFPIAGAAMLVRLVLRFEVALVFSVCLALMARQLVSADLPIAPYVLISSLIGIHGVADATRRFEAIKAGLRVAAINVAMIVCVLLLQGKFEGMWTILVSGLAGGLLSGLIVVAMAPLAEGIFRYLTPFSLMELASYEHPLLQQIMTKTPGTFQHSVTISALSEAAAEEIGADALLCRVGALFHDCGKSLHPEWFVENQAQGNPHDRLDDPFRSAEIIMQHVPDGVELALEHRLGDRIIDFIKEHHGTTMVSYFYNKAVRNAGEPCSVDPALFRYPGPTPQTRETAILMIADATEATSRTLKDRSYESVREMIDKTIARLREAGQFDHAPITQYDLAAIRESFCRVLTGVGKDRAAEIPRSEQSPNFDVTPEPTPRRRAGDRAPDAAGGVA